MFLNAYILCVFGYTGSFRFIPAVLSNSLVIDFFGLVSDVAFLEGATEAANLLKYFRYVYLRVCLLLSPQKHQTRGNSSKTTGLTKGQDENLKAVLR